MKILTGFAIINDRNGERVTFTYDEVDTLGNLTSSNIKKSYIAIDADTKTKIAGLRSLIETRMNETV
ncbi:hypothetical protein [Clostridium polynesiense]|uniref:hypothetical protein n=1 Tax=Clostridium polynesiense TaxID=1325933 RepID=UPI00058EAC20|nr:hypothetical protein [Clostridium polynesiense]